MPKGLRINIEEVPIPMRYSFSLVNFHNFSTTTESGTPCYTEFMKLVECINKKIEVQCWTQYQDLIKCLRSNGFDK